VGKLTLLPHWVLVHGDGIAVEENRFATRRDVASLPFTVKWVKPGEGTKRQARRLAHTSLPMMSGAAAMDQMAICVRASSSVMQSLPMSSIS
jgi:hypothetical protein